MFEPAKQVSLRKELFDRRRSKMRRSDESEKNGSRILSYVLIFHLFIKMKLMIDNFRGLLYGILRKVHNMNILKENGE